MFKRLVLYIFLSAVALSQSPNITLVEYFIDTDPGRGSGTSVGSPADSIIDIDFTVNMAAITNGMHTLYIRVMAVSEVWGIQLTPTESCS